MEIIVYLRDDTIEIIPLGLPMDTDVTTKKFRKLMVQEIIASGIEFHRIRLIQT